MIEKWSPLEEITRLGQIEKYIYYEFTMHVIW